MSVAFREKIDMAVFGPLPGFVRLSFRLALDEARSAEAAAADLAIAAAAAAERIAVDEPRLRIWREAYRDLGLPAAIASPAETLLAWARHPGGVPSQGPVPDLINAFMLDHLLPAAAYDLDALRGDLWLRPSRGCELHMPLGQARPESPEINELILVDGHEQVFAREWHGRQGASTAAGAGSRRILVHLDLLDMDEAGERSLIEDFERRVQRLLGARLEARRLSWEQPEARWPASDRDAIAGSGA